MLWRVIQENCKLRGEKKEKERVRKTKRRSKAYIQAKPRDLSCDQHVTRHRPPRTVGNAFLGDIFLSFPVRPILPSFRDSLPPLLKDLWVFIA